MAISLLDLRTELSSLEAELKSDPRHKKVEHLRALISLYDEGATLPAEGAGLFSQSTTTWPPTGAVKSLPVEPKEVATETIAVRSGDFHPVPKKQRFKEVAEKALANVPSLHRKDLLEIMVREKVMGTEKDLLSAFASNMYGLKEFFESDGKGNFRLRHNKQPATSATTGKSGFFN